MSSKYIETHLLRNAFAANLLNRLVVLIDEQSEALLLDANLELPSRAISTLLLLGERGPLTTADLAEVLGQPHQLVAQRLALLLKLGVIQRQDDLQDKRRKLLKLTAKGYLQFDRLEDYLQKAQVVFNDLFTEINCDLSLAVTKGFNALKERSMLERINDLTPSHFKPS